MSDYDDAAAAAHYENPENLRPVGKGKQPNRPARTLGKGVPIRFPESLTLEIKQIADHDGMTVSAWIRHVVTREVERRRPRPITAVMTPKGWFIHFDSLMPPSTSAAQPPEQPFAAEPLIAAG